MIDSVDASKPKERKWKIGDELMLIAPKSRHVIIGVDEPVLVHRIGGPGTNHVYSKSLWRNLTILAEMEAGK